MLLAVFAVHAQGLNYSPAQYLFLVVLTLLVSIGTVGVPGTATITATSLFAAAGLPIPFIAISQPISQIVDMGRTALNVAGQALVPTIVAKREGILDLDLYNAPRKGVAFDNADADGEAVSNEVASTSTESASVGEALEVSEEDRGSADSAETETREVAAAAR